MVMLTAVVCTALAAWFIGSLLVRVLGWPTNREALGRWFMALLVSSVLFSMAPAVVRRLGTALGPLPSVSLDELVPTLFVIATTILGYVAWRRGDGARDDARARAEQTRLDERRRADAPAPTAPSEGAGRFRAVRRPEDTPP